MGIVEQVENWQGAMTVDDLASLLKVSPKSIYKAIKKGRLPVIRLGSIIRLCPATTANYLRQRFSGEL